MQNETENQPQVSEGENIQIALNRAVAALAQKYPKQEIIIDWQNAVQFLNDLSEHFNENKPLQYTQEQINEQIDTLHLMFIFSVFGNNHSSN